MEREKKSRKEREKFRTAGKGSSSGERGKNNFLFFLQPTVIAPSGRVVAPEDGKIAPHSLLLIYKRKDGATLFYSRSLSDLSTI